jgi:hypothetical protein
MPIKSINKLPDRAQKMFNTVEATALNKGIPSNRASQVAWKIVKDNYTESRMKKSVAVTQTMGNVADTFVDVILGFPMRDAHNQFLTENFWSKRPMGVLKGDMEHYYADRAEGLYIDDSEDYEGWVPVAQKFWHNDDGKLMARVELPENHAFTDTFLGGWKAGDYGVSIEYVAPEEAFEFEWMGGDLIETIDEGTITGFTFTKSPALDTKPKQDE